jgi:hypothetical protein
VTKEKLKEKTKADKTKKQVDGAQNRRKRWLKPIFKKKENPNQKFPNIKFHS